MTPWHAASVTWCQKWSGCALKALPAIALACSPDTSLGIANDCHLQAAYCRQVDCINVITQQLWKPATVLVLVSISRVELVAPWKCQFLIDLAKPIRELCSGLHRVPGDEHSSSDYAVPCGISEQPPTVLAHSIHPVNEVSKVAQFHRRVQLWTATMTQSSVNHVKGETTMQPLHNWRLWKQMQCTTRSDKVKKTQVLTLNRQLIGKCKEFRNAKDTNHTACTEELAGNKAMQLEQEHPTEVTAHMHIMAHGLENVGSHYSNQVLYWAKNKLGSLRSSINSKKTPPGMS